MVLVARRWQKYKQKYEHRRGTGIWSHRFVLPCGRESEKRRKSADVNEHSSRYECTCREEKAFHLADTRFRAFAIHRTMPCVMGTRPVLQILRSRLNTNNPVCTVCTAQHNADSFVVSVKIENYRPPDTFVEAADKGGKIRSQYLRVRCPAWAFWYLRDFRGIHSLRTLRFLLQRQLQNYNVNEGLQNLNLRHLPSGRRKCFLRFIRK